MTSPVTSIPQEQLYTVISTFLQSVTGFSQQLVIQGLPNRDAMPLASPGFATMQITLANRLNYNIDTWGPTDPAPTSVNVETHYKGRLQVDFYGAASGDLAAIFASLWRDETGCLALEPTCDPLYTDDPFLAPLDDSEEQYEQRWTVNAYFQYNPVVSVPMTFANELEVTLVSVDEAYPP